MALPVTITGLSTAVAPVGPYKSTGAFLTVAQQPSPYAFGGISGSANNSGQTFTTTSAVNLYAVLAHVLTVGTPTDSIVADIYATSGGFPTGSSLGTSLPILASALSGTASAQTFTFSSPIALSTSTVYAFILSRTGIGSDTNRYALTTSTSTSVYAGGNVVSRNPAGSWSASSTQDAGFTLFGDPAYYFFGRDSTTATTLRCWKSTAPDTSWTNTVTKTGFTTAILSLSGFQSGSTIHFTVQDGTSPSSVANKYVSYDTTTDTFLATTETIVAASILHPSSGAGMGTSLCVRSTGEVVAFFNGVETKTSGTFRSRVYYSRRTAVNTWSAVVEVDAAAAVDAKYPIAVLGLADRVHFLWSETNTLQRTITSANALQTQTQNASGAVSLVDCVEYDVGGTNKSIVTSGGNLVFYFDSGNTPVINSSVPALVDNRITFNGTTAYLIGRNSTDNDVYIRTSTDNGATWTTAVSSLAGTVVAGGLSLNMFGCYQRGSYIVVPYVVNDNATFKYNEYAIPTNDAWSVNDKSASITLSNNDKSSNNTVGTSAGVRSTTGYPNGSGTGKYYVEFKLDAGLTNIVGLKSATASLTSQSAESVYVSSSGNISINGVNSGSTVGGTTTAGDVICLAWIPATERVWFRKNNGLWNNDAAADPSTGTGGVDISAEPNINFHLYHFTASIAQSVTVRTEADDLVYVAPSGFRSWMNETPDGWNQNDKLGTAVFSNNDKTSINSGIGTGAARSTKGYSTIGTGKYYVEFVAIYPAGSGDAVGFSPDTNVLSNYGNTINLQTGSPDVRCNNVAVGAYAASVYANGDVLCCAWNMQTKRFWARKNNELWNNSATADPATGVGGYDVSAALSARYCLWYTQNFPDCGATIRTELADLGYTIPSGFVTWMGESLGPTAYVLPADKGSYTITDVGIPAILRYGRIPLAAAKGSYSINGNDSGIPITTPWTPFQVDLTYTQLSESTSSGPHYVSRPYTFIKGDSYLFCIDYKPNGPNPRGIYLINNLAYGPNSSYISITGSNTGIETSSGFQSGYWTLDQHSITTTANGYYKTLVRGTYIEPNQVSRDGQLQIYLYSTSNSYTGDGSSGFAFQNYKALHYSVFNAAQGSYGITGNDATLSKIVAAKVLTADTGNYFYNAIEALNPADKSPNVTLSNNNLTATKTIASVGTLYYSTVRGVTSRSSGKLYFEYKTTDTSTNNYAMLGLATRALGLEENSGSPQPIQAWPGSDNESVGFYYEGSIGANNMWSVYYDRAILFQTDGVTNGYTPGDDICFAVDISAGKTWVRINNGLWNANSSANPVTGVGGLDTPGITGKTLYPCIALNEVNEQITARFSTSYNRSVPSSFGDWSTSQVTTLTAKHSLLAARGSYAIVGSAATLRATHASLVAANGAYAIAGKAVILQAGRKFVAAQGAYATAGKAATLTATRKLAAAQGSYAVAGKAATLASTRKFSAAQGAYAVSGKDVILRYVLATNVAVSIPYGIIGRPATLTQTHLPLIAAQGSYAVAGKAADLDCGRRLIAAQGTYNYSGKVATLTATRKLVAAQGAYATAGKVATFTAIRKLSLAQGAYAVAGKDAILRFTSATNAAISIPYGITGFPARLTQTHKPLIAAQGSYSVTGRPAVRGYSLSFAQGSYAYAGKAATLRYGRIALAAASGTYASTGRLATLTQGHRLIASQGVYSVTGRPATFTHAYTLSLAKGSYAVTGRVALRAYGLLSAQGAYAISGKIVTTKVRRSLASAQGSYAITGNLADLRKVGSFSFDMGRGSFGIIGNAVTFIRTIKFLSNRGSYTYTGNATGLRRGFTLGTAIGSYAFVGKDIILQSNHRLIAAKGVYASIGNASTKIHEHNLIALSRAYTVTGQSAGSKRRYQSAVASGVYSISENDADLKFIQHGSFTGDRGSFALSGNPVTFLLTNSRSDAYGVAGSEVTFIRTFRKYSAEIEREHETKPTLVAQSTVYVGNLEHDPSHPVTVVQSGKVHVGNMEEHHPFSVKKVSD